MWWLGVYLYMKIKQSQTPVSEATGCFHQDSVYLHYETQPEPLGLSHLLLLGTLGLFAVL